MTERGGWIPWGVSAESPRAAARSDDPERSAAEGYERADVQRMFPKLA